MKTPILWLMPPKEYEYSGIYKYSSLIADQLQKSHPGIGKRLDLRPIPYAPSSFFRYIYQLLILPLLLITVYRNNVKILSDESFLLATLLPFFPFHNTVFIIHDYRDYTLTTENPSFYEKIYFKILKASFTRLKKADHVVSVSSFTQKKLESAFGVNSTVIPNPFQREENPSHPSELSEKYDIELDNKVILTVSSEESRKNVDVLLRALHQIPEAQLVKVGSPIITENREKHLQIVDKLNLKDRVLFLENVSEQDLAGLYSCADVFVLISSFEGFGRPPIEAQMYGCPVVVSDIKVFRDNLQDSCVFVKDFSNSPAVAEALNEILKEKKQREILSDKGRDNSERFNISHVTNIFRDVVEGVDYD